jgi:methionyl-tRNA synthetase
MAPWALKKEHPERMKAVLATLFVCIRDLAIAIRPVIPASADRLLDMMGVPADERDYANLGDVYWYERLASKPQPIFPRLQLEPEEAA